MTGAEAWEVRVFWRPVPEVTCPRVTTHVAHSEDQAIDMAVSVLDGCCHPWALVKASAAQIRRANDDGPWRTVPGARPQT